MKTLIAVLGLAAAGAAAQNWQSKFDVDRKDLGVRGANPYFKLTPGYTLRFAHGADTDTLRVLAETKTIDGVQCRIVEDHEKKNGTTAEVTRDYYAIDSRTNDVYYMGEDVDVYRKGKVAGHEGSWRSGVNGARFGLMMPGSPKAGQRFYQEQAAGIAMDRAEVVAAGERAVTPAGAFEDCARVAESSALEPEAKDEKVYCRGIGLVRDGEMRLVKISLDSPATGDRKL